MSVSKSRPRPPVGRSPSEPEDRLQQRHERVKEQAQAAHGHDEAQDGPEEVVPELNRAHGDHVVNPGHAPEEEPDEGHRAHRAVLDHVHQAAEGRDGHLADGLPADGAHHEEAREHREDRADVRVEGPHPPPVGEGGHPDEYRGWHLDDLADAKGGHKDGEAHEAPAEALALQGGPEGLDAEVLPEARPPAQVADERHHERE
mmetsp:Transcript_26505/g.88788  ORF Transcript_26505/g.88788 Transcript_26505/m.88788 type:complete len:202 (+) Transcript_26505:170-775(+)